MLGNKKSKAAKQQAPSRVIGFGEMGSYREEGLGFLFLDPRPHGGERFHEPDFAARFDWLGAVHRIHADQIRGLARY